MIANDPILLPDQFNAAEYFIDRHLTQGRGDKVAIECCDLNVTYRQLYEHVNRAGNALRQLEVRIEERVFLLLLDTPEFPASFFGAIKIGAVPVPVNTLLKPADYEYMLNNSRARVAIVSDSLYPQLHAIPDGRKPWEILSSRKSRAKKQRHPCWLARDPALASSVQAIC